MSRPAPLRIRFGSQIKPLRAHLDWEGDLVLDDCSLCDGICASLSDLERDLLRVAGAVCLLDRLVRRNGRASLGCSRQLEAQVEVGKPAFWRQGGVSELVEHALWQVSDDIWSLRFVGGRASPPPDGNLPLLRPASIVALYSGGLDSAAGLATRLQLGGESVIAVTGYHQPGQSRRVAEQTQALGRHYGAQVSPLIVRVAMVNPPPFKQQERTQRCRAFLFLALGGVVASRTGASRVEVYENGVGALNLPLMTGMLVGSRTTKGAHPAFLRTMTELISRVAGRRIEFALPWRWMTKRELVATLADDGLAEVAQATVSCAHYPIRARGGVKQCGLCPGCIGRRQALILAGVEEQSGAYQYDVFGPAPNCAIPRERQMLDLKATLMQVDDLAELRDDGLKPDILHRHLIGTDVLVSQEPVRPWVETLRRYRDEWLQLAAQTGRAQPWVAWLASAQAVACNRGVE